MEEEEEEIIDDIKLFLAGLSNFVFVFLFCFFIKQTCICCMASIIMLWCFSCLFSAYLSLLSICVLCYDPSVLC